MSTSCDKRGGQSAGTSNLTINYFKQNATTISQRYGTRYNNEARQDTMTQWHKDATTRRRNDATTQQLDDSATMRQVGQQETQRSATTWRVNARGQEATTRGRETAQQPNKQTNKQQTNNKRTTNEQMNKQTNKQSGSDVRQ